MLKVEIKGVRTPDQFDEVRRIVGGHPYRQGTEENLFADFPYRDSADLAIVNLNLVPGVRARISGEPWKAEEWQRLK
jgi:hypothetical protein